LLALLVLLATTSVRADDGEEPEYSPFPRVSLAGAFQIHGSELAGHYERDAGVAVELAAGNGRWQYLVEGSGASGERMHTPGAVARGALGIRWLARQFAPESDQTIELFAVGTGGAARYSLDGAVATRGELSLGAGMQIRLLHHPRFAIRFDARTLFTGTSRTGFVTGFGVAW
jgi:hypothetical protein